MKKGVVFTIDAVLAFGVFISSLFLFSQFFVDTSFEGIAKTTVYSQSEEFLKAWENDDNMFYTVYTNYVNDDSNEETLVIILHTFTVAMTGVNQTSPYPANLRFYVFNNSQMQLIAESSEYAFEQNIVLRRFVIYKNLIEISNLGTVTNISAGAGLPNSTINVDVTVENPSSVNWTNVVVNSSVFGQNWNVTPESYSTSLLSGDSKNFEFEVDVPINAIAYGYTFKVNLSYNNGTLQNELYDQSFYIIQYGLVEMEVGLK